MVNINFLISGGIGLVVLGIILAVGATVNADLKVDLTDNVSKSVIDNATVGLTNISTKMGLIGTVIVFTFIIGLVMVFAGIAGGTGKR